MKEITELFRASPLEVVKQHADVCLQCVEALPAVFEADNGREEGLQKVRELERQADEIKAQIRHQMTKKLFMPVSKSHLLELIHTQDKVANRAKDIATLYFHRFDDLPGNINALLTDFIKTNIAVVRQATRSVNELDELIETGFRGVEADLVTKMVSELDELESASDRHQWEIFAELKKLEADISPVDAMFVYRLVTLIADLGDGADRTGRLLEQMISSS